MVLPNITRAQFEKAELGLAIEPHRVLCQDEMGESVDAEDMQSYLWGMFPYAMRGVMSLPQMDRVRWIMFPEVRVQVTGELFDDADEAAELPSIMRVMDLQQEQLARSLGDGHRVIHGVAGSGKTMILGYRAEYLAQASTASSKPILILCFNEPLGVKLHSVMQAKGLGGNLPARNIFLYRPTRGVDTPLDADGFWNLAGRAGRMSRDVQGNVFLVDYETWDSKPVDQTAVVGVEPALKRALTDSRAQIIEYAASEDQRSGDEETDFMESVFTRLCIDHAAGRLESTLTRTLGPDAVEAEDLKKSVMEAMRHVTLPHEVIKKSRLVSPVRQQALFDYFLTKIDKGEIEDLVPLHPLVPFNEGRTRLLKIFYRIDRHIRGRKYNAAKYFSGLALRWMRGDSLKTLIDASVEYKIGKTKKDKDTVNYGTIIRTLMTQVETELRFQYVRYTTCYLEVLRYAFAVRKIERRGEMPNLPLHLELGAASTTMISCLELGMSRIAAQEASDAMQNTNMTPAAVRVWISRVPLQGSLSPLVVREFVRLGLR